MRKTKFQNDYYYHIYNRGVDKRNIFMDEKDYIRFLISMKEFNTTETIDSLYRLKQLEKKERQVAPEALRFKTDRSASGATPMDALVEIIAYALLPNHYLTGLKDFKDVQEYRDLVDIIIKESKEKKQEIKKYLLE